MWRSGLGNSFLDVLEMPANFVGIFVFGGLVFVGWVCAKEVLSSRSLPRDWLVLLAWAQKYQKPKATTKLQPHKANSRPRRSCQPSARHSLKLTGYD